MYAEKYHELVNSDRSEPEIVFIYSIFASEDTKEFHCTDAAAKTHLHYFYVPHPFGYASSTCGCECAHTLCQRSPVSIIS